MRLAWLLCVTPCADSLQLQLNNGARHTQPRMTAAAATAAGELQRVVLGVSDLAHARGFYMGLGLSSHESEQAHCVIGAAAGGLCVELNEQGGGMYQPESGYRGLSVRVPSVAAAVEAGIAAGGTLLKEVAVVAHGPSAQPEEADDVQNDIVEATLADPNGYPVLLHESKSNEVAITGARCNVYEWMASQQW